jgi:hypothetical protein
MTILLLLTVIVIYEQVVEGEEGMNKQLQESSVHMRGSIQRLSP